MLHKYSQIKSVYVKNFRNIGEAKITFSESPIVSLVGDNEAGKTSIVKAFAVCSLHAWPRDQKDYIRDGTNGFGIAIELEDGSLITRMKTATLNKYAVKKSNGEMWEIPKIDAGLPVQVSELMGLIEEPETKEYLQVRTYEDQLLFVVTPASLNYKVMYDALKVDQISRAIKIGSKEANDFKSEISSNGIKIEALMHNLKGVKVYDIEPLVNIRDRIVSQLGIIDKLERALQIAKSIKVNKDSLGALSLLDEYSLSEIELVEVNNLVYINRLIENKNKMKKLLSIVEKSNTAEDVDLTIVSKIVDTINKKNNLIVKIKDAGALVKIDGLEEINEYVVQQLARAVRINETVKKESKILKIIDVDGCELIKQDDFDILVKIYNIKQKAIRNDYLIIEVQKYDDVVNQIEQYLKQCGAAVTDCPKCGESIVLDTELLIGK